MSYIEPSEADWERYLEAGQRIVNRPSDSIVDTFRKVYGDQTIAAGLALLRRLRSDKWKTQEGVELLPIEMTVSHAKNTVRWLEQRAPIVHLAAQLEAMCEAENHDGGDMAQDDLDQMSNMLAEMDPIDFLRDLPLYRAIAEHANLRM